MNLSASGASGSAGRALTVTVIPLTLSASGASVSSGRAACATAQPPGAVADFAVWRSYIPDPAMSLIQADATLDSTGRTYLTATIPVAYQTALGTLWNAAASAAVTETFQHSGTNAAVFSQVQIERQPGINLLPPDAADYRDRMVYTQGSATVGAVTTWDAAVERVAGHALSGTWCAELTNSGGLNPYSMAALPAAMTPVVAGAVYQGEVCVSLGRAGATFSAQMQWYDANYNLVGSTYGGATVHPGGYAYQQAVVVGVASGVYGAVVPAVNPAAVGDGETAYADCHRLTSLNPGLTAVPSAFQPARQQIVTVRANRVNYALNPGFTQDIGGWWGAGGTTGTPAVWDGTVGRSSLGSLKVSVPYVAGSPPPECGSYIVGQSGVIPGIAAGRSGDTFTLSAYVLPAPGMPAIWMYAVLGGPNGTLVAGSSTAQTEPDDEGYHRLSVTLTVPGSVSGALGVRFAVSPSDWAAYGQNAEWWVDDVLVERSPLLGTFFDATLPSPDYVWEGTAFRSRSHYYQNFRFLQYRLSALIEDALPAGVAYQILFAQPDS